VTELIEVTVPCSPEQEDVLADYILRGAPLGLLPDERAWIMAHVKKLHPTGVIKGADLDIASSEWTVKVQL
jgi:hypothetical protein